jgi:hypothetical protein
MNLLRHILRKFHKCDYTDTAAYPKSVVSRPENYGMEIFVYCTLKSHNLPIPSLFPVIFDIDYADLFQTQFYYRRYK